MMYANHKIGDQYMRGNTVRTVIGLVEDGRWVKCLVVFLSSGKSKYSTYFWNDPKLVEAKKIHTN